MVVMVGKVPLVLFSACRVANAHTDSPGTVLVRPLAAEV